MSNSYTAIIKAVKKNQEGELVNEFERDYRGYIEIDLFPYLSKILRVFTGVPQTVADLLKKYSVKDRRIIRKKFRINVEKNTAVRKKQKSEII